MGWPHRHNLGGRGGCRLDHNRLTDGQPLELIGMAYVLSLARPGSGGLLGHHRPARVHSARRDPCRPSARHRGQYICALWLGLAVSDHEVNLRENSPSDGVSTPLASDLAEIREPLRRNQDTDPGRLTARSTGVSNAIPHGAKRGL